MDGPSSFAADRTLPAIRLGRRGRWRWRGRGLQGSDASWALAFLVPYVAVFLLFVLYPVGYAIWLGHHPADWVDLAHDPIYWQTVINTLIYLACGVNLHLFGALLISGFFMRKSWLVRGVLLIYILPWAIPAIPIFIAIHWMLNGQWGFLNNLLWDAFGINGPDWLDSHWLGMASVVWSYIWKWMPFWTVIFLAGRMAIPQDVYEAAAVDGATGIKRFCYITFPMLGNLYLVCTLLSTIWTLGDFNTVYFVTGGGPAWTTEVLATLGIRDAFTIDNPQLGMAAVLSALPLLIPLVIILMRRLSRGDVQL